MADGLRIYFDFILRDYLLYKQELEQANVLLSPENLQNFSYVGSEKPYVSFEYHKTLGNSSSIQFRTSHFSSLGAVLSFKQGAVNGLATDSAETQPIQLNETRRLRSHKNTEENEFILDLGAVAQQTNDSKCGAAQVTQMSSLGLLKQILPSNIAVTNKVTRDLLQEILAWKLLPCDVSAVEPSMVFGAVHLSRLVVKLPDFVNATPMPDEKLKLLIQNLDNFIE